MSAAFALGLKEYPLLCAPMATLSHRAFRELVEEFGAPSLYFSEMISATALFAGAPYEESYVDAGPDPSRLVYQLVGSDADAIARAAAFLDARGCFGIDVNMGCDAPAIMRHRAGAAWMRSLEDAARLFSKVRPRVVRGTLSAKIRIGPSEDAEYLARFGRMLQDEGADFITLHPRTVAEKFKRSSRWEFVGTLQAALGIPVFANGDVRSREDYAAKREAYRPEGIMIGRLAAKCPWVFSRIRALENGERGGLSVALEATAARFIDLVENLLPPDFRASRIKRFFHYYCDNFSFPHAVKMKIQNSADAAAVRMALEEYFGSVPSDRVKEF
jgi:tRNA-dihydrouridine synthase B